MARSAQSIDSKSHNYLIRCPEVCKRMGVGRSTLYSMIKMGKFPKPVHPSERISAWFADEVEAFVSGLRCMA